MSLIEKAAIEKGKELFWYLKDECDGSYVGAEMSDSFDFEGVEYNIEITGFWESSNHFDYYVTGKDFKLSGTIDL